MPSCGSSLCFSLNSINFLRIRVCIGVWSSVYQDFQFSGTRKCYFAARVFLFVYVGGQIGIIFWGFPNRLVWFLWIKPEWLKRTLQSAFFLLDTVIPLYLLLWLLLCFRFLSQLSEKSADLMSPYCFPIVSQYLLFSTLRSGGQRLWSFLLSLVVS